MHAELIEALDTFLEAVSVAAKWRQMDPLVTRTEKKIGAIFKKQGQLFLRGFAKLKGQIGEAYLSEALTADDWISVFDLATGATTEGFFEIIQGAASEALGRGASQTLADVNIDIAFNLRNPRAESYLQQHGYGLISQIDSVTRGNIATIIDNGTAEGWSYNRMAREISSLYSQMAVGKPQQHIDSRAHLIAVTEIGNAYEEGGAIVINDLQDAGLQMEKSWLTVGDDRVSEGCQSNAAEGWIPQGQSFSSGHMTPLRFPGCRCTVLYRRQPSTAATTVTLPTVTLPKPTAAPTPAPVVAVPDDTTDDTPETPAIATPQQQQLQYRAPQAQIDTVEQYIDENLARLAARYKTTPEEMERVASETFASLVKDNDMAIQFKSSNLDSLLTDGRFKTQFETKTSGGALDLEYRARAEANGLGIPVDVDPKERPIYGYLNLGKLSQNLVANYGDITFILKDEARARSTVTMDDSLANFDMKRVAGTPINEPGKPSLDGHMGALWDYAKSGDLTDILYASSYIEVQIQGGVALEDMKAVIDRKGVLTAEQRSRLQEMGIAIWDN